jgi:hypothetical protein
VSAIWLDSTNGLGNAPVYESPNWTRFLIFSPHGHAFAPRVESTATAAKPEETFMVVSC